MVNQSQTYFSALVRKSKLLSVKEKTILLSRLKKKTLRMIAKRFKLSAERIRQIEKKAIGKLGKKAQQMFLFE